MLKKEIGRLFPNLNTTVAYYSPTSFCITLNKITEEEYKTLFNGQIDKNVSEKLSILYHEMRHHLDHVSTLWGQRHIQLLAEAIDARLILDEKEFWKIVKLKTEERQRQFATYYTEYYNSIPWTKAHGNWKYDFSTGIRFSDEGKPDDTKPIMFLKFKTFDEQPLVRVPISISSLLETNSTKEELEILGGYINTLPEDDRIVEGALFHNKTFQEVIYNQNLALYNVAVHLAANILDISEVITAFKVSSSIATLVLNLPDTVLERIPIQDEDIAIWGQRPMHLVNNFEYGYIFYVLLNNYASVYKKEKQYNLSSVLAANNLPEEEELERLILTELKKNYRSFESLSNIKNNMQTITKVGAEFFLERGIDGSKCTIAHLISNHGYRPNIICSDTDFPATFNDIKDIFSNRPIDNLNPVQWYNFSLMMDSKMEEFYNIRGL